MTVILAQLADADGSVVTSAGWYADRYGSSYGVPGPASFTAQADGSPPPVITLTSAVSVFTRGPGGGGTCGNRADMYSLTGSTIWGAPLNSVVYLYTHTYSVPVLTGVGAPAPARG